MEITERGCLRQLTWEFLSIAVHLDELHRFWAKRLQITGPQWMMLLAILELDGGDGVQLNAVAKMLHVDPSFVTTQSKIIESKGLINRKPSPTDARIVRMSLSRKVRRFLLDFDLQENELSEYILAELNSRERSDLANRLSSLKTRLHKACLKVAADY
jgi:DNA-binding MarR family transcriptional regulator